MQIVDLLDHLNNLRQVQQKKKEPVLFIILPVILYNNSEPFEPSPKKEELKAPEEPEAPEEFDINSITFSTIDCARTGSPFCAVYEANVSTA